MSRTLLQFHEVDFSYQHRSVLRRASFSLEAGSSTALIGPNGIGKTTLLRLASGLLHPDAGRVDFDDAPLSRLSVRQAARQIAMVPQHLEVPFDYTVQEIVEQGRTPYRSLFGSLSSDDRREVDRALELTRTSQLRHRIFNELSGGERQRVKIALGLAQQPRLLLLDEPTQNLDIGRQVELLSVLRQLRETGLTLLASMHDLHLLREEFSSIILLGQSGSPQVGSPSCILEPSLLAEAFDCSSSDHPFFAQLRSQRTTSGKL